MQIGGFFMLSIEAMLAVPLSMVIFIQGIMYVHPIQIRIENQTKQIAENRLDLVKNAHLLKTFENNEMTKLETNPQKVQEIISLFTDIGQIVSDKSEE